MTDTTLPDIGEVTFEVIDGLEIRLARKGTADGLPVVLFSPWPESLYAYRGVLGIAENHPAILMDLPGFGLSEGRRSVLSPKATADFIIAAAAHLGLKRLHAMGPDIGTPALLFAAAKAPQLFESIVIGGGASRVELTGDGLKALIFAPPGAFGAMAGGDIGTSFVRQSSNPMPPDAVLEDYRLASAGRRFEEACDFVRAYVTELPELNTQLSSIATPTLIMAGRHDAMVPPPNGDFLKERLPHARHVLLEGGHLIWEEATKNYEAELVHWLEGGYRTF